MDVQTDPELPLFCDTETCGFYGKISLLQLMQKGWDEPVLIRWPDPHELAMFIGQHHTVWHNAHYDITTIQQQTGTRWIPNRLDCTFLLSRIALPRNAAFSLDAVLETLLGYDPYIRAGLDKKKLQKTDWSAEILTPEQLQYASIDVQHMPALWELVNQESPSYSLDMHVLRKCLDFQWNGMPVDQQRIAEMTVANTARIEEIGVKINVNSWQQVRAHLGSTESDDLALAAMIADGNTEAAKIRETKKLKKQLSFLKKYDKPRVLGKFKPSAKSGRLTSSDDNLQQIPRALKRVFGYTPDNGRVLVFSDYAQLELRTICAIVNCELMAELFREGADLHGFVAKMIFGDDWTPEHRQITKTYNFNLLYGGGVDMIISILLKSVGTQAKRADTQRAKARWLSLWREIAAWQQRGIAAWRKGRLGHTPLGRPYTGKLMTDQLNIENQGAGAEVAKLALHYLNLPEDVQLVNFIHDSYILDCPSDPAIYEPVAKQLADTMQEAWTEMSKCFQISDLPMPVEVRVGYNWGGIEKGDFLYSITV